MADGESGGLVGKENSKGVKQTFGNGVDVFKRSVSKLGICGVVLFTLIVTILLGIGIPIAAIVLGTLNKDNCILDRHIPIYLIVAGAGGLISNLLGTFCRPIRDDEENAPQWRRSLADNCGCCVKFLTFINGLLGIFLFAWFIAGNVWVFRAYGDFKKNNLSCDTATYWFAFVTIAITDAIICLCLVIAILVCCCACCCAALSSN